MEEYLRSVKKGFLGLYGALDWIYQIVYELMKSKGIVRERMQFSAPDAQPTFYTFIIIIVIY